MQLFITSGALAEHDQFMKVYQFDRVIACPDRPNRDWKPKSERVCRFCGGAEPEVTFRSDAHWIPQFMGNRYLIFQEECDRCNSHFSNYETHLANHIGPALTLYSVMGKGNRVPKFKRSENDLTAVKEPFYGMDGVVVEKGGEILADLNVQTGQASVPYRKQGYVPLKAYKALLKIAATCLKDADMPDYVWLLRFLQSDQLDQPLAEMAFFKQYSIPIDYRSPVVYLFRRRQDRDDLPTHVCMIYFSFFVFEFAIPGNVKDAYMQEGKAITPIYMPPFFWQPVPEVDFYGHLVSLSGREMVKGEEGEFLFNVDPEDLKGLTAFDPATCKVVDREFEADKIVKMVIGRGDDSLNLPIDFD